MSENPKAYLTEKQIVAALREIVEEPNAERRAELARALGETNAPDVIDGALKDSGISPVFRPEGGDKRGGRA